MNPNTEWKKVFLSLIAAAFFIVLCLVSVLFIDGMSGGFALAFVSFFLAISSGVVALLFFTRARVMDTILADPSPLAHWVYPEDKAQENVEREYREFQERNRIMFMVIGAMMVVAALFFLIFVEEGGFETCLILLGITVLLFVVSRITPLLERRRAMSATHDAVITRAGIIYEGSVYPFRSFLVFWHGVTFREAGRKKPAALVFSFSQLVGRFIIQPFDVVVPVPVGEEERGGRVVRELGGELPEEKA
ncbi:MAG: hypothetical protein WC379_10795 [Methanoregula sp.]|jgi:uncharacterized membrane protein